MRKIDMFCHLTPPNYGRKVAEIGGRLEGMLKRTNNVRLLHDLDARFRVMDQFDDYCQVVTLSSPQPWALGGPDRSPDFARLANDSFAELVTAHPDRFAGFVAALPMNNPDAAVKEADRAIGDLGACGVEFLSNIGGKPLDAPEFLPLWETMARHDLPVWIHPTRAASQSDYASEPQSKYEIWFAFGFPYETSVAMSRIVFSGLFDRFPNLKIITHHMGGMIPFQEGRVGPGWEQMGSRTSDQDLSGLLAGLKRPHHEYFHMFYGDTAMFGGRAGTVCGLDYFGVDHVVFASDMPFDPRPGQYIADTIKVIESLDVTPEERERIYCKNAQKLMRLAS